MDCKKIVDLIELLIVNWVANLIDCKLIELSEKIEALRPLGGGREKEDENWVIRTKNFKFEDEERIWILNSGKRVERFEI